MNIKKIGAAVLLGTLVVGCGNADKSASSDGACDQGCTDGACAAKAELKPGPVLSVNGEVLTREAINADIDAMLKAQGDKVPAEQQEYFRQMVQNQIAQSFIVEKVLVAKAKAAGFTVTDADRKEREAEFLKAVAKMPDAPKTMDDYFKKFPLGEKRARAEFENGILIDKMIKEAQSKEKGAEDFAAKAKEIIAKITAENAKAATSDADALKKIKELQAELAKVPAAKVAEKFAELAKANSACPSSAKGGDLGEFTHGQMVKEFDEVAFKLPVNKVSEPVKTQFGYHLIMTTKKVPAVEAKGENPAQPEKVQASHILVKTQTAQPVPTEEEVVGRMKKQGERMFVQKFVMDEVKKAKIEALADDFKQFVPPADKPEAAPAEKKAESVEKPAGK